MIIIKLLSFIDRYIMVYYYVLFCMCSTGYKFDFVNKKIVLL